MRRIASKNIFTAAAWIPGSRPNDKKAVLADGLFN
jgi:hypothetical protein